MQCKLDENLPRELASLLCEAGHDAVTVNEQSLQGTDDASLIAVCKREHRTLITLDVGFADIRAYPPGDYSGIVVLRLAILDKQHILRTTSRLLGAFAGTDLAGQLWIIEESRIRIHSP